MDYDSDTIPMDYDSIVTRTANIGIITDFSDTEVIAILDKRVKEKLLTNKIVFYEIENYLTFLRNKGCFEQFGENAENADFEAIKETLELTEFIDKITDYIRRSPLIKFNIGMLYCDSGRKEKGRELFAEIKEDLASDPIWESVKNGTFAQGTVMSHSSDLLVSEFLIAIYEGDRELIGKFLEIFDMGEDAGRNQISGELSPDEEYGYIPGWFCDIAIQDQLYIYSGLKKLGFDDRASYEAVSVAEYVNTSFEIITDYIIFEFSETDPDNRHFIGAYIKLLFKSYNSVLRRIYDLLSAHLIWLLIVFYFIDTESRIFSINTLRYL